MALHVRKTDERSELQQRIETELQEKLRQRTLMADEPDGVDDSRYIEGTKRTTTLAWAWILIGVAAVAIIIWLVIASTV